MVLVPGFRFRFPELTVDFTTVTVKYLLKVWSKILNPITDALWRHINARIIQCRRATGIGFKKPQTRLQLLWWHHINVYTMSQSNWNWF